MEMTRQKRIIIDDKGKKQETKGLKLTDKRKVTVITKYNKDKTKKYYSYQLSMPMTYIHALVDLDAPEKDSAFYFIEHHKQHYEIKTHDIRNYAFKIKSIPINENNKTMQFTLPKRHMEYLRAYDNYIELIDNLDKDLKEVFKLQPLEAEIVIDIIPNTYYDLSYKVNVNFSVNISKEFTEYVRNIFESTPGWLKVLSTNWRNERFKELAEDVMNY